MTMKKNAKHACNPIAFLGCWLAINEENMIENVAAINTLLMKKLDDLKAKYPELITEIRGKGVMIGIELAHSGMEVMKACLDAGLIINCTKGTVLRLLPAINVTPAEIDEGIRILDAVLEKHQ